MPATITAGISTLAAGLSVPVYRDEAPEGAALPRIVVIEGLFESPRQHGDMVVSAVDETIQVDLWQQWRHPTTNAVVENYRLADQLKNALHGRSIALDNAGHVYGLQFVSVVRLVEREQNLVHHAFTFQARRNVRT